MGNRDNIHTTGKGVEITTMVLINNRKSANEGFQRSVNIFAMVHSHTCAYLLPQNIERHHL